MTKRSPAAVLILSLLTLGIYHIVWYVKTKGEMVRAGATIPSAWFLLLGVFVFPVALWWMWKWSQGVEHVTRGKSGAGITFIMLLLVNQFFFIGSAIIQGSLNKAIDEGMPGQLPQARVA